MSILKIRNAYVSDTHTQQVELISDGKKRADVGQSTDWHKNQFFTLKCVLQHWREFFHSHSLTLTETELCKQFMFHRCNWINIYVSQAIVITFCVLLSNWVRKYSLTILYSRLQHLWKSSNAKLFIKMQCNFITNLNKTIYREMDWKR